MRGIKGKLELDPGWPPSAVAGVLDHPGEYRDELSTLMTERFAIVEVEQAVA